MRGSRAGKLHERSTYMEGKYRIFQRSRCLWGVIDTDGGLDVRKDFTSLRNAREWCKTGAIALDEEEVDVAIAEAISLMPKNTCVEDMGEAVRKALSAAGYRVMKA